MPRWPRASKAGRACPIPSAAWSGRRPDGSPGPAPAAPAAIGDNPAVLGEALRDEVNLAVWERQLPLHISDYARCLLGLGNP